MYPECLIGFDCRKINTTFTDPQVYGQEGLLNHHVRRVLAMDHARWPSVINIPGSPSDPDYWDLPFPEEPSTPMGFMEDLAHIKRYLNDHKAFYHGQFWLIALTVVETPAWKTIFENQYGMYWPCLASLDSVQSSQNWTLLGYDVEGTLGSGLGRNWIEAFEQPRKPHWSPKLNENHLFTNAHDADDYTAWHMSQSPDDGDLMVFGLYLVEALSL